MCSFRSDLLAAFGAALLSSATEKREKWDIMGSSRNHAESEREADTRFGCGILVDSCARFEQSCRLAHVQFALGVFDFQRTSARTSPAE